jgi:8-oxo-dGTP pyrophosphatase MutT (NUDIX family)
MHKAGEIRVIVLALIRDGNRIFVSEGYDAAKHSYFYRALGGGVEFGETSSVALEREFQEEIQAKLTNIRYLTCIENLFIYNDQQGHEIIQLYQCDFADSRFYQIESLTFAETPSLTFPETPKREHQALWVDIAKFQSGELRLVPEIFLQYL